ncbi:unnamed protein product [Clavelina lepadiformis]|uniref:Uncharacterized protein n=1 Tax=Clavelina lepadiformis TaxID=159417 RepID=A0ABP0FYE8_CLALP
MKGFYLKVLLLFLAELRLTSQRHLPSLDNPQRHDEPASNHLTDDDVEDIHGTDVTRQIEEMFRSHSYELSIKPSNKEKPVKVGISLMIESITDISEKNMDLTFTLCIHENWRDERLKFSSDVRNSIVLPSRLVQKIWVPDIYIVGSKNSFIHQTTVENAILRLYNDGNITYNIKLTTTVACQMSLHNFPLDTENCSLTIQSLGYNYEELLLEWMMPNHDALFMSPQLVKNMPKFRLVSQHYRNNNVTKPDVTTLKEAKVSQVQINFIFRRYLLSVFFQSYFLGMSMVVLAGLGMWLDPRSVPARVTISVTSVLTMSTIINGLKTSLPKVSYLTAMDIYLWICFLFIFATVLEFCVFNHFMTKQKLRKSFFSDSKRSSSTNDDENGLFLPNGNISAEECKTCRRCKLAIRKDNLTSQQKNHDCLQRHQPPVTEEQKPKEKFEKFRRRRSKSILLKLLKRCYHCSP